MRPLSGFARNAPQQPVAPRDPAPSRAAYRMQRLWLTPSFRKFTMVGLPILCVALGGAVFFAGQERRDAVSGKIAEIRRSVAERPEFMVNLMAIDGASIEVSEDIREILPVDFPISSFDLDLESMRQTVEGLDAVARVDLRIRPGGILQVEIEERVPAVVWRGRDAIEILDHEGHRVAHLVARAQRPDLPLVAGDGANAAVPEALAVLKAAEPIADRMRGLVRMGERRWDLVLDRGQRILLPEERPVQALERVIALNKVQDLLARDLVAIDMRNEKRPTLRLSKPAADELREAKLQQMGVSRNE
ncbi:cell division protein FtsQ/DivIB [Pseudoruegeria sp. SHC-113]|uniref:cell division protein FtsQ/DivIB n=1 Tax=Pseudoruegeria sp. SHC-113 TaxID=2855439 RepID=UPI0021BB2FCA|nr:cell division protein FtsQ/DivIB [Pseudoruegeria sp. SHC-113]MCT8161028.1 cell division protein FtsQ/DivIB [Pseudoruegeria sp. SHC-113]